MFWCVLYYLGAFGTVWLPYKTRCKTDRTSAKVREWSRVGIFHNEHTHPPHWTLNWCFGAFRTIWVHLAPFGCLTKLGAKRAELVQKFMPRSRIGIFHNERTRSTPLDHKLMFWCDSYYLGASGTFWLPYESQYKTVWVSAKVREWNRVGIFRTERTRSTPLDPKLMFWCLLFYLGVFGTVWLSYDNRGKTGRTSAKVHATKSRRNFSHRTHPIHPIIP